MKSRISNLITQLSRKYREDKLSTSYRVHFDKKKKEKRNLHFELISPPKCIVPAF